MKYFIMILKLRWEEGKVCLFDREKKPPAKQIINVYSQEPLMLWKHHPSTLCSLLLTSWVSVSIKWSFAIFSRGIPICFNAQIKAVLVLNWYCGITEILICEEAGNTQWMIDNIMVRQRNIVQLKVVKGCLEELAFIPICATQKDLPVRDWNISTCSDWWYVIFFTCPVL